MPRPPDHPEGSLLDSFHTGSVPSLVGAVAADQSALQALLGLAIAAETLVEADESMDEVGRSLETLGRSQGFASVALWRYAASPRPHYVIHARWRAADHAVPESVEVARWGLGPVHEDLLQGRDAEVERGQDPRLDSILDVYGDERVLLVPIRGSTTYWGAAMFAAPAGSTQPWTPLARSCLRTFAAIMAGSVRRREELLVHERLRAQLADARHQGELGTLAAGVAHDIRNLLTILRGKLHLATARGQVASETMASLDQTLDATDALAHQLYAFSGLEKRTDTAVDLVRLWQKGLALLQSSIPPEVSARHTAPDDLPPVRGDITQLGQALGNLVKNAIEAVVSQGGGRIHLTASVQEWRGVRGVCVYVEDDGPGVDAQVRDRIFDPLVSTRGARRGVGLAAARSIVESHRGRIWLDTSHGSGTRFGVWLPAWTQDDPQAAHHTLQ